MSTAKKEMLRFVAELPDDLSQGELEEEVLHNIRYNRHIRSIVEKGEEDIKEGRHISHEELKRKRGRG